jgi:hypothetical protein
VHEISIHQPIDKIIPTQNIITELSKLQANQVHLVATVHGSLTVDINLNTDMHPLILITYTCLAAMLLSNIDNLIIQTLHHCIRYGMSGSLGTQIFMNPSGCFGSVSKMVPLRVCRQIKMQQQQQQTIYMRNMYFTKISRTGCRTIVTTMRAVV